MDSEKIIAAVGAVTNRWARQRKTEERDAQAKLRRREVLTRYRSVTLRQAAWVVMEDAYLRASAGGTLPAHARQIMYAARPGIQKRTGRIVKDQYFTQTLLPDYMEQHPRETATWNVVFDARGHFQEPHTKIIVPLGTLAVRGYLNEIHGYKTTKGKMDLEIYKEHLYPTKGPLDRYGAIMFIEKEGFFPLFDKVRLAERFDIAIMSTKGMTVTASRWLVDELGGEFGIPLLVLHDFDKAGFSIVGTLCRNTRRYRFQHNIQVIDFGIRLEDVEEYQLESEEVYHRSDPENNLMDNGASRKEVDFLLTHRVELNAFTSGDMVDWIENKLDRLGVKKVVPEEKTLRAGFRWALEQEFLDSHLDDLSDQAAEYSAKVTLPEKLQDKIARKLKAERSISWDEAVRSIARECFKDSEDEHNRYDD